MVVDYLERYRAHHGIEPQRHMLLGIFELGPAEPHAQPLGGFDDVGKDFDGRAGVAEEFFRQFGAFLIGYAIFGWPRLFLTGHRFFFLSCSHGGRS